MSPCNAKQVGQKTDAKFFWHHFLLESQTFPDGWTTTVSYEKCPLLTISLTQRTVHELGFGNFSIIFQEAPTIACYLSDTWLWQICRSFSRGSCVFPNARQVVGQKEMSSKKFGSTSFSNRSPKPSPTKKTATPVLRKTSIAAAHLARPKDRPRAGFWPIFFGRRPQPLPTGGAPLTRSNAVHPTRLVDPICGSSLRGVRAPPRNAPRVGKKMRCQRHFLLLL